jgi:hypothetical protein
LQLSRRTDVDPLPALHALLDLPRAAAEPGRRVLVSFDEFQDLDRVSGAVELVRSHIQHHGEVAGYCFAGSAPGMMRALFGQRSQPLYAQAVPVEHGPLSDADAGEYITARFAEHRRSPAGRARRAARGGARPPERLMLLAHNLFAGDGRRRAPADAGSFQRALARFARASSATSSRACGMGWARPSAGSCAPWRTASDRSPSRHTRLHGLDRRRRVTAAFATCASGARCGPRSNGWSTRLLERWIRQRYPGLSSHDRPGRGLPAPRSRRSLSIILDHGRRLETPTPGPSSPARPPLGHRPAGGGGRDGRARLAA